MFFLVLENVTLKFIRKSKCVRIMKKKMEREGLRGGGGLGRSDSPYPKSRHHKAMAESGVLARQ